MHKAYPAIHIYTAPMPGLHVQIAKYALWIAAASIMVVATACGPIANTRPGMKSVLEVFQPPTPEEALKLATDEFDANKRYQGLSVITGAPYASEASYVQLFEDRLNDSDPGVRALAARALGSHGSPDNALSIAKLLTTDADATVRIESARALQRLHNPAVVESLFTALDPAKESDIRVRTEAASALGHYGEARVVERLIAAMSDESLPVNLRVQSSLRTLTGHDFGTSQQAWQAWYTQNESALASGGGYTYPTFSRGKRWFEYVPFVPGPPNESTGVPAGVLPAGR
jgi:hypothetical protein